MFGWFLLNSATITELIRLFGKQRAYNRKGNFLVNILTGTGIFKRTKFTIEI